MKPILFNTEMVRAILDGRKTETRRIPSKKIRDKWFDYDEWVMAVATPESTSMTEYYEQYLPYQPGNVLYVCETWCKYGDLDGAERIIDGTEKYYYRADGENPTPYNTFLVHRNGHDEYRDFPVWKPAIHMPREAARIFLRVTDVRVERLQDITEEQVYEEGFQFTPPCLTRVSADGHTCDFDGPCTSSIKYCDMSMGELFGKELWNSTIKKSDLDRYGWEANPWVYVISFERISKDEAMKGEK